MECVLIAFLNLEDDVGKCNIYKCVDCEVVIYTKLDCSSRCIQIFKYSLLKRDQDICLFLHNVVIITTALYCVFWLLEEVRKERER